MYYVGFDIGGTKCAVSLGKWDGSNIEIVARHESETMSDPCQTLEVLSAFVEAWKKEYKIQKAGISCGGPLDSERGVLLSVPNLAAEWHGFKIVSYIKERFDLESRLENDANASAVAEWKFGAGRNTKNMIFMTFGTGLGAGLILNGRLYAGANGNAGEVGHIRLAEDGPIGYNKAGSAEGFCSGGGIKRLAELRAKEQRVMLPDDVSARTIFEAARQGDAFHASIVKESAERFATVVSLLIDLFNPELIVAGGVFMRNYDLFMPIMEPVIGREALEESKKICRIMPAMLQENIGDYAALAIAVLED